MKQLILCNLLITKDLTQRRGGAEIAKEEVMYQSKLSRRGIGTNNFDTTTHYFPSAISAARTEDMRRSMFEKITEISSAALRE